MKKLSITILAAILVTGCGSTYTLEGNKYGSKPEFLRATQTISDDAVSSIQPLPSPLTNKSLVFAIASANLVKQNAIQLHKERQMKDLMSGEIDVLDGLARSDQISAEGFGKGIQRRNIYKSVNMVTMESAKSVPEASAGTDVLYVISADGKPAQWYFVSHKSGRQIFAYDQAVSNMKQRTKNFVDAVQAYALRDN